MVQREAELRFSAEWQSRFAAAERRPDTDWLECVEELQLQVVREFGLPAAAAQTLRTAHLAYPDEPIFQEVPVYVRFNRARNGPLRVGAVVQEEVPIVELDGSPASLWDLGGDGQPVVLIGGSHS